MSQIHPSYKQGFYPAIGRPANPDLWDVLSGAWEPSLGAESSNTLSDLTGYGNNATLTNTAWNPTDLYFDATAYGQIPLAWAPITAGEPFTIIARAKLLSFAHNGFPTLCQFRIGTEAFLVMLSNVAGFVGVAIGSVDVGWANKNTGQTDLTGRWINYAITYDGGAASSGFSFLIYNDGVAIDSFTMGASYAAHTEQSLIGAFDPGFAAKWKGEISHVSLYRTVLTQRQIQLLTDDPSALTRRLPINYTPTRAEATGVFTPYYYHNLLAS